MNNDLSVILPSLYCIHYYYYLFILPQHSEALVMDQDTIVLRNVQTEQKEDLGPKQFTI